ncbi:MAG: hypothetical protein IJ189_08605 [Clostridia bacterium]|nr:hypothetical protein [Clostridia bacterium]
MKKMVLIFAVFCLLPLLPALADTKPPALQEIPAGYFEPTEQQGTMEEMYYDTWESFTYEEHSRALTKRAMRWVFGSL